MPTTREAFDALVDPLQRVGRPDLAPVRPWERGEREYLGLDLVHQRAELMEPGSELLAGLLPRRVYLGGRGLGEDRAERGGDVVGLGLGDVGERLRAKWTRHR